ncbi:hypothetical protein MAPG_08759 [Magnaporthiopsis poae ATCC 64411]|uniref:Uncharacterized protein n=1 Tax=Magnaporthiopsis poae (strain ATCC 64411 / 73-15) TaxID=644358 RepID=A0A0C4E869_MAGP6|nr:hypothetical protein MAPG_08759 [Magnaporthiopsis poae ATCC 64411]
MMENQAGVATTQPPPADYPVKKWAEAWKSLMEHCEKELEKLQLHEALRIRSADDLTAELTRLQAYYSGNLEITALLRALDLEHYSRFSHNFARAMSHKVDLSMTWGLLAKMLSVESGTISSRTNDFINDVCFKLAYLNEV